MLNFLKKLLHIGETVASVVATVYGGPVGTLVGKLLTGITNAEAQIGSGKGTVKQELVQLFMTNDAAAIEAIFATAGKPIKNPELFTTSVNQMQEGIMGILNSTGDLAKP